MRDEAFKRTMAAWNRVSLEQPTSRELELLEEAFKGLFTKNGKRRRKSAEPWQGFMEVRLNENKEVVRTANEESKKKCLRNCFWYFVNAHLSPGSFMGTMFTLQSKVGCLNEHLGYENRSVRLFDLLDTMAMLTIISHGGTCKAADKWAEVLGGAEVLEDSTNV